MRIHYEALLYGENGKIHYEDECDLKEGINKISMTLYGELIYISSWVVFETKPEEKIFMNGYQTWTYCPEFTAADRLRKWGDLPKSVVKHYGLNHYGDYHFALYFRMRGIFHGYSYCYFRDGDRYRFFGSLNEKPGYTVFRYDSRIHGLSIDRDVEGLHWEGEYPALEFYYAEGTEQQVFDGWFEALGIKPRTEEKLKGYSSWYNRYEKISQDSIMADLNGCAQMLQPGDLFQIDDGWEKAVGDWEIDEKKFPQGLKGIVDEIHGRGLKAGLWLAPFGAAKKSRLAAEHPEWLLKVNEEPWLAGSNWGGFYALDLDNEEFVEYLRGVFDKVLNQWGFDLVKLDFLYAAAPYGNERETRAGRMIRAMELLRELCGEKLILGCGVPLMPAFGLADYCRVSCDVGLDWDGNWLMQQLHRERVSTKQAIENSIFRRQLNGRAFLSDPDVFFLRDDNIKLSQDEKNKLATVCSLFNGIMLCSDDMSKYSHEAKTMYEQLLRNRQAQDVRVEADEGLKIKYKVDGEEKLLVLR